MKELSFALSLFEHKISLFDYKFGCKGMNIKWKKMISLTIFICFNFHFNPNLLGNNAIARIFEHCGLMNRFGFNLIYQVKGVSLRKI